MALQKAYRAKDRYFDPNPRQREVALELYNQVRDLPLICPHGHVDPRMFADPNYSYGSPADLLIIPDHYVFRMLYSQGIPLESLGVPRIDGEEVEKDHRKIWQIFADNFYLFRGTPTGLWLEDELYFVFDVKEKLTRESARQIYDQIEEKLASPEFRPRELYKRFNIEVLCTTDAATDPLESHRAIRESGWDGCVLPTFRPDNVVNLDAPGWHDNINALSDLTRLDIKDYTSFILALEGRRAYFKKMGAKATDHGVRTPYTEELDGKEAGDIFQNALKGDVSPDEVIRFTGHLLIEMARMSIEDGLVMQLHAGPYRNHNVWLYERFGPDAGCDIPVQTEYTCNLHELLNKYGNDPRLTLILFTLDETAFSRELAPLAGHYPAVKLGPPWWFLDSLYGMSRFRKLVSETAGIYNTAGFNDDTRAYPSIPVRHDLSRRVDANWIAELVVRDIVDMDDAQEMIVDTAYRLTKTAYKFD